MTRPNDGLSGRIAGVAAALLCLSVGALADAGTVTGRFLYADRTSYFSSK